MSSTSWRGLETTSPKNSLVFGWTASRHCVQVVRVLHERHGDAELLQRVGQQVVGSAVEAGAGHHVVAGLGDVQDREGLGGLAGAEQQRREPAFQTGHALFHGVLGGVADPGVDGGEFGEREAVGGAFGAGEDERRRLVDRQRPGAGGGVRLLAGVDLAGFEGPGSWTSETPSRDWAQAARGSSARAGAGAALALRRTPDGQVFTRGTPPRYEGCRPASRGCVLALMTWLQSRNAAGRWIAL